MLDRTQFAYCRRLRRCAIATGPETVEVWEVPDGLDAESTVKVEQPLHTIETGRSRVVGVAFVGPRHVLTAHELGACVVWELPPAEQSGGETTADATSSKEAPAGESSQEASSATETPTATQTAGPEELWSDELGLEICAFQSRTREGAPADRCALGGRSGAVAVLAFEGESLEPSIASAEGHATDVTSFAFAPRSERLASGGRDKGLYVWQADPGGFREPGTEATADSTPAEAAKTETPKGEAQQTPEGGAREGGTSQAASTEESNAGAGSRGPDEGPAGSEPLPGRRLPEPLELTGSEGWPVTLEFSRDGTRLVSAALDNALYLWDPRAEDTLQAVNNHHDNWITELAWSPDDTRIATGSWDTSAGLFRSSNLAPLYRFDVHTDFVSGLMFLEESKHLVTASYDGTLAVWDWEEGALVDQFRAHSDWIEVLVPANDGRALTVSSEDVIRIWDVETGVELAELGDASFEGFDLGREVDFSNYVEVPELSSETLEQTEQKVGKLETVQKFSRGEGSAIPSESGSSDTAVGLLENAIEESDRGRESGGTGTDRAGVSERGATMLDARLETDQEGSEGSATASEKFVAEEGGEKRQRPGPADGEEVDRAFAEISEVETETGAGDGASSSSTAASSASATDASTGTAEPSGSGGVEEADAAESTGESPAHSAPTEKIEVDLDETAESESEEIDQFGKPIEERIEDASLDMPDDLDSADFADSDIGQVGGAADAGIEPGETGEESAVEPGVSPTSGASEAARSGSGGSTGAPSASEEFSAEAGDHETPSGLSSSPSPQLGRPATDQSSEQIETGESGGTANTDGARGRRGRDTMKASGSDLASNTHRPEDDVAEGSSFSGEGRNPETDVRGRPSASGGREGSSSRSNSSSQPSEGATRTTGGPRSSSASGETTVGSTDGSEESPSADALKAKFEQLKQSKEKLDSKRDREDRGASTAGEEAASSASRSRRSSGGDDGDAPAAELYDASASEIWDERPEPDKPDRAPAEATSSKETASDRKFVLRHAFLTPHDHVYGVVADPAEEFLGSCGDDGSAFLWSFGGRQKLRIPSDNDELNDLALTPDGRVLCAASDDTRIHLWLLPEKVDDAPSASVRHATLDEHEAWVTSVATAPRGRHLVSGSFDGTARIWSLVDGTCKAVLTEHEQPVLDVAWGEGPVTVGKDGAVRFWNADGELRQRSAGYGTITDVAARGSDACWTTSSGGVYQRRDGETLELRAHDGEARGAAYSPGGLLATGGADERLHVYPSGSSQPGQLLRMHTTAWSVFARDHIIGAGGDDGRVYLFELE